MAPVGPGRRHGPDIHASGTDVRALTVGQVLATKALRNGDKRFLTYLPDGRTYTYAELDATTDRVANGLAALGLGAGDIVAVWMDNCPEQILAYFGLGKIGAVAVPINTAFRGEQLRYFLAHSGAVALVADGPLLEHLRPDVRPAELRLVIRLGAGVGADLEFGDLLKAPAAKRPDPARFSDTCSLAYTSGTTGPSKGVIFTHARTFMYPLSHIAAYGYRADDIYYVTLPLFHINALQGSTYNALMADASVVLQRRFSASGFWNDIRRSRATVTNLLGSMTNMLWDRPATSGDRDHEIRMCLVAPVPPFARAFEQRFGLRFIAGYGATDYGASHAYTLDDPPEKLGSSGRPRRGYEARIVDADDLDVPPGEPGELLLRCNTPWEAGGQYHRAPEASVAAMRNGWFHTGDRGYIDDDGYLWFVDRIKDAIRRRGENISSFEVEQVLLRHESVQDVAVFAVASEMSEDEVAAVIVPRTGRQVDFDALARHCAAELAYFAVPRYLRTAEELPRNASQKVEKFKLRREAESDLGRYWDRERHAREVRSREK